MAYRMLLVGRLLLCVLLMANGALPAFAYNHGNQRAAQPAVMMQGLPQMPDAPSMPGKPAVFGTSGDIPLPLQDTHLSEVGQRMYSVPTAKAKRWKGSVSGFDQLHFAEYVLATENQPAQAEQLLSDLIRRGSSPSKLLSLAKRAKGFALFYQGRYRDAANYFRELCLSKQAGDRIKELQGFLGHAESCAGFHESRARLGIYEPGRTDPLCGVRSLAKCLERFGQGFTESTVAKVVRYDGLGSNSVDIVNGAEALGFTARTVLGQPEIVRHLPLPVIAHVEHDHFVAVVAVSDKWLKYWCVDCHGERVVTWDQWQAMEPDGYITVTKAESAEDQMLGLALHPSSALFAAMNPVTNPFGLASAYVQTGYAGIERFNCTARPTGIPCKGCPPCAQPCAMITVGADPVNVASGGEEYMPGPDLTVYNPSGPDVVWGREYFSLGNPAENGFGNNWTHSYNLVVNRYALGGEGEINGGVPLVDIILPSSAHLKYQLPTGAHVPDATHTATVTMVPTEGGAACVLKWKWDAATQQDYFEIYFEGGTIIRTTARETHPPSSMGSAISYVFPGYVYRIASIVDTLGHGIHFSYEDHERTYSLAGTNNELTYYVRLLKRITNDSNDTLLELGIGGNACYNKATDRDGRHVNYVVTPLTSGSIPNGAINRVYCLTQVSQIAEASVQNPSAEFEYGYTNESNGDNEQIPTLHTISEPSPTGTGWAVTTIAYDSLGRVQWVSDPNGHKTELEYRTGNETYVTLKDTSSNLIEATLYTYDDKMNIHQVVNASGVAVTKYSYGNAGNPYRPTQVKDAYDHTWTLNWDAFGHLLSVATPRGITRTNTYENPGNAPVGRLVESQVTGQTSTTLEYNSNGLLESINSPIPGQSNTGNRQTTEFTYDSLGSILTITSPGNNAESAHTTTFGYGSTGKSSKPWLSPSRPL